MAYRRQLARPRAGGIVRTFAPATLAAASLCLAPDAHAGTWTRVTRSAPGTVALMMLMSDGSVMAANNGGAIGSAWYRLKPDIHGSYINGTWSSRASSHDTRLWYSSAILKDGRLFVAGGEYGTGGPKAEVFDPVTNLWTQLNVPTNVLDAGAGNLFYDSDCIVVANGNVLIAPVLPRTSNTCVIYNPTTNTWSTGPSYAHNVGYQDEATWVKLPDQSILTVDPFGTLSERYIPSSNTWIADSNLPVQLYDPYGFEMGGGCLLPDGRVFMLGATGHTAYYTPSGSNAPGVWTAGPDIPGGKGTPDAPCCMMVNGKILCAVSPAPVSSDHFPAPTSFYEFDPVANSFTAINGPFGPTYGDSTYTQLMLALPDGTVLYSHMSGDLWVYNPSGAPLAAGKPTIQSVTDNGNGSFHLTGTGLNGISQGASYGDDAQMDSNYPLVRFTDLSGNVYYGRTFNWSSTGVQTGAQVLSTDFKLPSTLPAGQYSVVAVANGFASDPSAQQITAPAPTVPSSFSIVFPTPGATGVSTEPNLDWQDSSPGVFYDLTISTHADLSAANLVLTVNTSNLVLTPGTLQTGTTYYWSVVARDLNEATTNSTPVIASFTTLIPPQPCRGDFTGAHHVDTVALGIVLSNFGHTVTPGTNGDANGDGVVNTIDLGIVLSEFGRTDCP